MSQELIKLANKIDTSVQLDYGKLGKDEEKSEKTWNDLIKVWVFYCLKIKNLGGTKRCRKEA